MGSPNQSFSLPFVQGELEAANAEGYESEAHKVDFEMLGLLHAKLEMRWVFDHAVAEIERDETDGDVNEEDPVPVEVICNPAAQSGADRWCDNDRHAINRKGLAAFFDWEGVGKNGLFAGGEAATTSALQDAREDKERKRVRNAAEE